MDSISRVLSQLQEFSVSCVTAPGEAPGSSSLVSSGLHPTHLFPMLIQSVSFCCKKKKKNNKTKQNQTKRQLSHGYNCMLSPPSESAPLGVVLGTPTNMG